MSRAFVRQIVFTVLLAACGENPEEPVAPSDIDNPAGVTAPLQPAAQQAEEDEGGLCVASVNIDVVETTTVIKTPSSILVRQDWHESRLGCVSARQEGHIDCVVYVAHGERVGYVQIPFNLHSNP